MSRSSEEPKRVLAIVGSPRRNGNTEILVDEILAGAEENGASTQKIILSDLDITPCIGCDSCKRTSKCIHQDDMSELLALMKDSDVWVLATPVYWWAPPAQFKVFLDRWHGANKPDIFHGKDTILAVVLESEKPAQYNPILNMFKGIMKHLKMKHLATVLVPGVYDKGAIHEIPDKLAFARKVGHEAAEKRVLVSPI